MNWLKPQTFAAQGRLLPADFVNLPAMALILNIDTAVENASICLAENDSLLSLLQNPTQKDHAGWLLVGVDEILKGRGLKPADLDAVAVTSGPGSYTGLRVGLATAKGLCYALKIPLITLNTLEMMAAAATGVQAELLCPMIDARRMEVFTALYDPQLRPVVPPTNLILEPASFGEYLAHQVICFFGNGSMKFRDVVAHANARFENIQVSAKHMVILSYTKYRANAFANLAYSEPDYGKEFYSIPAKQSI